MSEKKFPNQHSAGLDDLFAAAKNDATYMESEESRRLLLNNAMAKDQPSIISSKEISSLRHTPISKGVFFMSTLSVVTAAVSLWFMLGNSATAPTSPIQATAPVSARPQTESIVEANTAQVKAALVASGAIPEVQAIPPVMPRDTEAGWLSPVNLSTIRPQTLTPDQLHRLGIVADPNGDVRIYSRDTAGTITGAAIYPPKRGFEFIRGGDYGVDTTDLNASRLYPRMVTNLDGSKRSYRFQLGSAFIKGAGQDVFAMGDSSHGVKMSANISISNGDTDAMDTRLKSLGVDKTIDAATADPATRKLLDSLLQCAGVQKRMIIGDDKNIKISQNSSSHIDTSMSESSVRVIQTSDNASDPAIDSLIKHMGGANHHGTVTININATKTLNPSDSAAYMGMMKSTIDSLTNMSPTAITNMVTSIVDQARQQQPEINKLIPVLVASPNTQNKGGVILWYDPTPEVLNAVNALPHSSVQSITDQNSSSLTLYPNPASSTVKLKYQTSGAKSLTFSVYNLLGRKVLDAGTAENSAVVPVTGEKDVDLSGLQDGVYLVVATTETGQQNIQRLVISK